MTSFSKTNEIIETRKSSIQEPDSNLLTERLCKRDCIPRFMRNSKKSRPISQTLHAWSKLEEYYTLLDDSPLWTAAVILNPNQGIKWLRRTWRDEAQQPWLVTATDGLESCHGRICTQKNRDLFATIDEDSKLRKRREGKEAKTGFWGRDQVWRVRGPVGPAGLFDWLMEMRPDPHNNHPQISKVKEKI